MRGCFSVILLLFFFLSLASALFLFNVRNALLDPNNFKKALVENSSYETFVNKTLPSILNETFKEAPDTTIPASLMGDISKKIIQPSALQSDIELSLDQVLPYLNGKKDDLNFKIELSKYKDNFTQNFKPTIIGYINSLPACKSNTSVSNESIPSCKPKGGNAEQIYNQSGARETETSFIKSLPNEIIVSATGIEFNPPLEDKVNVEQERQFDLRKVRLADTKAGLERARIALLFSLMISIASLLLLAVLWQRDFKKSLTYISWGLLGFVIFLPLGVFLFLIPTSQLVRSFNISENWSWLAGVGISILKSILEPFFWQSVVCILLGAGILIFLKLLTNRHGTKIRNPLT